MRLLHHTAKRNKTSTSMVPTCRVPQTFSRGKLASFLSTGPTKVHQHPHLVGFLREILGGSQLYTPPKLNSSPPENDGKGRRSLEPFGCTGCWSKRRWFKFESSQSHTTIAPVVFNGWRVNFTSLVVKFMVVVEFTMGSQSLKKNHQKGKQIQDLLKKNWLFKNVIFMSWFMKHTPT